MSDPTFVSFAQNGEDVVLWRALSGVGQGRYVEVGANDPRHFSISRGFYERGWSGLTVEPVESYAAAHRRERPRDVLVQAAAGSRGGGTVVLHEIAGSGLSTVRDEISARHGADGFTVRDVEVPLQTLDEMLETAGFAGHDLHFVSIDVEGAEPEVLAGFSLDRWRPWVLVVESTEPLTTVDTRSAWEEGVLAAGYTFCQFDGLSRFYVSADHLDTLRAPLSYPAGLPGVLDDYVRDGDRELHSTLAQARADAVRWRGVALAGWAEAAGRRSTDHDYESLAHHASFLENELAAMRTTVSWRVTAPLRAVRTARGGRGSR